MQAQLHHSYQPPPIRQPSFTPASYYVQQPAPVAAHAWDYARAGGNANQLQASAPPLDS